MKHIILTLTLLLSCAALQATHLEVDPKVIENAPDQFEEAYQQEQARKAALRTLVGDEAYGQLSCAEGTPTVIILNNDCEAKIFDWNAYQAASQAGKASAQSSDAGCKCAAALSGCSKSVGTASCCGIVSILAIVLSVIALALSVAALRKRKSA